MPETPPDQACHCHLCEPGMKLLPIGDNVLEHVRGYGWHVQGVLEEGENPGWAYSIGLWHSYRSPEVALLGFPATEAMKIVNTLGGMVGDGAVLHPGQRLAGVFHGYDVMLRDINKNWYVRLFGQAIGFYQVPPLPMVQVCWPDREGRFPWDDGVAEAFSANQPDLWRHPDDQPAGVWSSVVEKFG